MVSSVPPPSDNEHSSLCCCAVCRCIGGSLFCAVYSCRPCASFFRRSVRDRREYNCRTNKNDCPIDKDGMRNCCRACRLRRCFQAGMRPELIASGGNVSSPKPKFVGYPNGPVEPLESSSPQQKRARIAPSVAHLPVKVNSFSPSSPGSFSSFPFANRISQSIRDFCEGEKAICAQHFGLGTVFGEKLLPITQEEHSVIEKGCVVLLLNFVRTQFPKIDSIPTQQKVGILKSFTFHFNFLHYCELTLKHRPAVEGHRQFVILPGCLFELEHFSKTFTGPGKQQQMAFGRSFLDRFCHFITHTYKSLAIESAEFAAIQGIQLWKCLEECVDLSGEFGTDHCPLNELFAELHCLIAASNGGGTNGRGVAIRFGRILSMLTEVSALGRELNELLTLCKVFLDPIPPKRTQQQNKQQPTQSPSHLCPSDQGLRIALCVVFKHFMRFS